MEPDFVENDRTRLLEFTLGILPSEGFARAEPPQGAEWSGRLQAPQRDVRGAAP